MSCNELKNKLLLVNEATALASSQLENRCIYYSLDWEIGLNVGSKGGDQSPVPFISMILSGISADGSISRHPVKLTVPQFNDFMQNVQRMQNSLSPY